MIENRILKPSGVIQLRGGTYAAMASANPLLARREIAVEIDTGKIKVGDGVHNWNDLPYSGGGDVSVIEITRGSGSTNVEDLEEVQAQIDQNAYANLTHSLNLSSEIANRREHVSYLITRIDVLTELIETIETGRDHRIDDLTELVESKDAKILLEQNIRIQDDNSLQQQNDELSHATLELSANISQIRELLRGEDK